MKDYMCKLNVTVLHKAIRMIILLDFLNSINALSNSQYFDIDKFEKLVIPGHALP